MNKLVILGFCPASVSILTELAHEIIETANFDIVHNIEAKESDVIYKNEDFIFEDFSAESYDFSQNQHPVVFGVRHSHIKHILFKFFKKNHNLSRDRFINLIHGKAYISRSVTYASGFIVEPMSVVSSFCQIGFGVDIKRSCSVGHHAMIQDYVCLNPGVVLSGYVSVGEGTEIGSGTSVVNNVSIGKRCLIGAGSVVTKDIPDGVVAYGNPCKVVSENKRWNFDGE